MKSKKKKYGRSPIMLTLLFSASYFVIAVISFTIVIWLRYLLYKSAIFSQDYVPPHISTILLAVMSVIIGTILSVFSMRMILKPLRLILDAVNRVAEGDYTVRVTPQGMKRFKKLALSFNNMVEEIGSAEILKKDFVNNFSHEFKTPITSVLGFARILKNDNLTEEERSEYLDIIISESERLTDLSQNILTLSRLENQPILPDIVEINISEQIRQCVALLYERLIQKNLDIDFDSGECVLPGNKTLLTQVWMNLTDNAIKFSPAGSTVKITAEQNDNYTIVCYCNHGTAIDDTAKKHIFDRFYQVDKSHKTEGNGLGLTLVNAIVKTHGGTIDITSDDEYEVKFIIKLPNYQGAI